jgi:alpha-methylacyl-CoA racemase
VAYKHIDCDKVILKDVKLSPQHILAQSSVLTTFGQQKEYYFPNFIVELTVSNALAIIALQILYERKFQNSLPFKPKTHYLSIAALIKYFGAFNISAKEVGMITKPRSENVLEGGAPYYSVYKCKDGFVAVGNLEPKFYMEMIRGLNLTA